MAEKKKPVHKIKVGTNEIAIWENESDKGKFLTWNWKRSYKVGEEWKDTTSGRISDIPQVQLLLNEAYKWAKITNKNTE